LAAHRFGIDTIILPKDKKDLPEVPEEVRNSMTINLVETIDECSRSRSKTYVRQLNDHADQPSAPPCDNEPPSQGIPTSESEVARLCWPVLALA